MKPRIRNPTFTQINDNQYNNLKLHVAEQNVTYDNSSNLNSNFKHLN